jgi:hypothetical protein
LAAADKKKQKRAAQKAKKALSNAATAAISVPGEEKEQPPKTTAEKTERLLMQLETKALLGMRQKTAQETMEETLEDEPGMLPSSSRGGTGDSNGGTTSTGVEDADYDEDAMDLVDESDVATAVSEGTKKYKYDCRGCGENTQASNLCPFNLNQWSGTLDVWCRECCIALTVQEFNLLSKKNWLLYAKTIMNKSRRRRTVTFDNLEAIYLKLLPKASQGERRKFIVLHLRVLGSHIAAYFSKNKYMQTASQAVYAEYCSELDKVGVDPFHVTEHTGWSISSSQAQYLTRITDHLVLSFVCRFCGGYGECWIQADHHYHFRCAFCGEFYRPWATNAVTSNYNKIMIFEDLVTSELTMIPCYWADTQEDNWVMAHAEIYARKMETPEDLKAFLSRKQVELATLLLQAGKPDHYIHHDYDSSLDYQFTRTREWSINSLTQVKAEGFWGGQWKPENHKDLPIFREWDTLAELVGSLMAGSKPALK